MPKVFKLVLGVNAVWLVTDIVLAILYGFGLYSETLDYQFVMKSWIGMGGMLYMFTMVYCMWGCCKEFIDYEEGRRNRVRR